jgi:hypothetical protein
VAKGHPRPIATVTTTAGHGADNVDGIDGQRVQPPPTEWAPPRAAATLAGANTTTA